MSERHYLVVAYYYPPMPSVGAMRLHNIFRCAKRSFGQVHVITTRNAFHFGPIEDPNVNAVTTLDYRSISLNQLKRKELHYGGKLTKSKWKRWAGQLMSTWPLQFTIGEGGGVYLHNAIAKAEELIAAHSISHIISSYPPMTDHHIANELKERYPDLYWIADFRDLPVDPFKKNILAEQWHRKKYQKMFQKADECWAVSKGQVELLSKTLEREVKMVRNGLPKEYSLNTTAFQSGPFRITYTGSLYPQYPYSVFIKALHRFQEIESNNDIDVEFHYAGKDGALMQTCLEEANWSGIWVDHGNVTLKESWELQQKSHVNILFSWSKEESKGILTGKLYEYLGARRPVLAIVEGEEEHELEKLVTRFHWDGSIVCYTAECASNYMQRLVQTCDNEEQTDLLGSEDKLKELYFSMELD